ncbi:MAG: hypothetical protein OXR84_03150 [Magnetovibrio sp.]|nr:hypothetical protein [Magnetovibrio sp.]
MIRLPTRLIFAAAAVVLALSAPSDGAAQSLNFGAGGDRPIEVFADNGIEWQQDRLVFIARGNARAVRGEVTVFADELRAYYREKEGGGTDIWRLDAFGKVRIKSPQSTTHGEHAVYDVDKAVLVVTGGKPRLITKTDTITADRQLEYWEQKQMAVARGNALARRAEKRLRADVLAAYFRKDKAGKSSIHRVEAFDNVKVVTQKDTAHSERGVYNVNSGIATLIGSVRILRDRNVLNGCSAEVNLNTGISRLHSCQAPLGGGKTRVRGVIMPQKLKSKDGDAGKAN